MGIHCSRRENKELEVGAFYVCSGIASRQLCWSRVSEEGSETEEVPEHMTSKANVRTLDFPPLFREVAGRF